MHVWVFSEFVSYVIQVGAVIVYTFVYHMLAPPKDAIALDEKEELCDEIDIKVESMNSEHANGFSGSILLEDIQKDDSMSVPLLLPRSSDTSPKVRGGWLQWLAHSSNLQNIFQPPVVASVCFIVPAPQ
jgi:hypothetical protein